MQQMLRSFFNGAEPHKGLGPEEVVAYGAAVQGDLLSAESQFEETLGEMWTDETVLSVRGTIMYLQCPVVVARLMLRPIVAGRPCLQLLELSGNLLSCCLQSQS